MGVAMRVAELDGRRQLPASGAAAPRAPHARARELLRGDVVSLLDWHCAGHDGDGGRASGMLPRATPPVEEVSAAHDVVVARRGAYVRQVGGHSVLAHAGNLTFWHPGEAYRITHPIPGGDVCSVFRLTPAGARSLLREHDPRVADRAAVRFPTLDAPLDGRSYLHHRLALAAAVAARAGSDRGAALAAEEHATAFLHAAVESAGARTGAAPATSARAPESRNRRAAEYTARVREVIAARFREPLTLAAIAAAVGCSPYHLSRIVSAHAGVSIYRLVIQLRLREALERVLDTRDSLSAIGLDAGFASQSHFGDAFRREFGCAPGDARRRGRLSVPPAR